MPPKLEEAPTKLRSHEAELRRLGASHVAVFGSVARGEATPDSDIAVLVELDDRRNLGVFQYARLQLVINQILGVESDFANARTLKPLLRDNILRDAVNAF